MATESLIMQNTLDKSPGLTSNSEVINKMLFDKTENDALQTTLKD